MSGMLNPQIILLKEGTDSSQGIPQIVSNINGKREALPAALAPPAAFAALPTKGCSRVPGPPRPAYWQACAYPVPDAPTRRNPRAVLRSAWPCFLEKKKLPYLAVFPRWP